MKKSYLIKSHLIKGIIGVPVVGGGAVCLTMQLTNQADVALNIGGLNLGDVPEIKEKEIDPVTPPPEPESSSSSSSSSASGTEQESNGGGGTGGGSAGGGGGAPNSGASSSQSGEQKPEDVIRYRMVEITNRANFWMSSRSLSSTYESIDRILGLASALQIWDKAQKEAQQTNSGAGGNS